MAKARSERRCLHADPGDVAGDLSTAASAAAQAAGLDEDLREFADGLAVLKAVVLPDDFRTGMAEAGGVLATYVARDFLEGNAQPFYTINTVCRRSAPIDHRQRG